MLKKTVTYTNPFTNEEVTEDHYFHLSKADLIEIQASQPGGMEEHIKKIIASEDNATILAEFKKILRYAYGKKVGDRFVKSEEVWNEFVSSEAYSAIFFELFTDAEEAAKFVAGIVPQGLDEEVAKIAARQAATNGGVSAEDIQPRTLTTEEATEMDADELQSGLATGRYKLS